MGPRKFLRNNVLDAKTYPATTINPYKQNQYGVFLGGPVIKNNTWFAGYWEGFRAEQTGSYLQPLSPTPCAGRTSLNAWHHPHRHGRSRRPEYANEIYDPHSTTTDPKNPTTVIRNPYPGNHPSTQFNSAALAILAKYYPAPNLNVAAGVLPNYAFTANTSTQADQVGIRIDHRFSNNDTVFFRYNRSNNNRSSPEAFPGYSEVLSNYTRAFAAGYTHLFGTNTILNINYGYTQTTFSLYDQPAGVDFLNALNFALTAPPKDNLPLGPGVGISNGYTGVSQFAAPVGPQHNNDYHADLSKVSGNHTIGIGGMYYHIHSFDDGWQYSLGFTSNGTSVDASQGGTGFGPASFLLVHPIVTPLG